METKTLWYVCKSCHTMDPLPLTARCGYCGDRNFRPATEAEIRVRMQQKFSDEVNQEGVKNETGK